VPREEDVHLTGLDLLLWALSLLGHIVLLAVLIIRRRVAIFPIFTTWISANILRTVILYFTLRFGSSDAYFYSYWTLAIVDLTLQLAVTLELASHIFRPLGAWAPDSRRIFTALAAVSVLVASVLTWLAIPTTRTLRLAIVIRGNFFSSVILSELFVCMIALSVTMGLPWRTHVARLAQGLGVFSVFGILTEAAHSYFGTPHGNQTYRLLSRIRIEIYLCALVYWIVTLAIKEPEPRKLPEQLHQELRDLQRRAALLLRNIRAVGSPS
jgi:hypothetical protein